MRRGNRDSFRSRDSREAEQRELIPPSGVRTLWGEENPSFRSQDPWEDFPSGVRTPGRKIGEGGFLKEDSDPVTSGGGVAKGYPTFIPLEKAK